MNRPYHIFVCAGELSGDALGAWLLDDLRARAAREGGVLSLSGMGGPALRRHADLGNLRHMEDIQTAGLAELLPRLPRVMQRYISLISTASRTKPDLAVLVDFPDFNLRLASWFTARGVPVLIYVPPQVWAWRASRVETLRHCADRVACLFRFEADWLARRGLFAEYVGQPRARFITPPPPPHAPRILLCPGSRPHEIDAIFPILCAAARRVSDRLPVTFGVLPAPGRKEQITRHMKREGVTFSVADLSYGWTLAWCAAGTMTLELALAEIPWILTHRVSPLSYRLMKGRLATPFLGMPNILLGRQAAPECVQDDLAPDGLSALTLAWLRDDSAQRLLREDWRMLRERLMRPPTRRVDEVAWDMLTRNKETT